MKNFEYLVHFRLDAKTAAEADARIGVITKALERLDARVISTAPANSKTEISHAIAMSADGVADYGRMSDARRAELGLGGAATGMSAERRAALGL